MGGENWETRLGRSRPGLLRSPRDLHLDLATLEPYNLYVIPHRFWRSLVPHLQRLDVSRQSETRVLVSLSEVLVSLSEWVLGLGTEEWFRIPGSR